MMRGFDRSNFEFLCRVSKILLSPNEEVNMIAVVMIERDYGKTV